MLKILCLKSLLLRILFQSKIPTPGIAPDPVQKRWLLVHTRSGYFCLEQDPE